MGTITPRSESKWDFPMPVPQKGALLSMGSFLFPSAGYTLVDFGRRTITRFTTVMDSLPDGDVERPLTSLISRPLSASELGGLIDAANKVWDPPPGMRRGSPLVTDSVCSVTLFDKDDVLNEFGMACPYVTEQFLTTLAAIKTARP